MRYVLQQGNHVMVRSLNSFVRAMLRQHKQCKHVLATRLASRMSACIERQMQVDDLVVLYMRRFSLSE